MKIDIWSDFACPFCYAGMKKFKQALNELDFSNDIEINHRSFQLNPNLKQGEYSDVIEQLADSYMTTREKAEKMMDGAVAFVEGEGLVYDFKNMIPANTSDAHRLIYYAKEFQKDTLLSDRIFKAHFEEVFDIGDRNTLSGLAEEVDLDKSKVLDMLNSHSYLEEIKKDELEAIKLNIEVVPTFIINDETRIAGALSSEDFLKALHAAEME